MTNTITEEVLKKIEEQYPLADKGSFISDFQNIAQVKLREAAIWGAFELDKWISVKDGLPEELVDVLVCMKRLNSDNYYFIVADYYEGQWNAGDREDLDNNPDFYVVTHYQYLPKPPKDII